MEEKIINLSKGIISNTNNYNVPYTSERVNVKRLRETLSVLYNDIMLLISALPPEENEELNKKLDALKDLRVSKTLTENRVRFWVNMLLPEMKILAEKIIVNANK